MLKCQVHEMKETRDSVTSHRDCLEEELAAVLSNLEKVEQESAEKEKASMDRFVNKFVDVQLDISILLSLAVQCSLDTRCNTRVNKQQCFLATVFRETRLPG